MRDNAHWHPGLKGSVKVEKGIYSQVFESPVFELGNDMAGFRAWQKDPTSKLLQHFDRMNSAFYFVSSDNKPVEWDSSKKAERVDTPDPRWI